MFCGVSLVGMIVLFFMLPETKNKTLEEVEELFMSKEYKQKHRSSKKYMKNNTIIPTRDTPQNI
jgi:hypothetical protein